jgi:hypothetical protein
MFAAATTYTDSTFYSLGGNVVPAMAGLPNMNVLQGLVSQDFSSTKWSNATTNIPNQNQYRTQAKAVHVTNFGDKGYIVYVGGESPPVEASLYESGTYMVDMATITLYDITSGTWFTQTATGDIPPPRSEFCAVGAASADGLFEMQVLLVMPIPTHLN